MRGRREGKGIFMLRLPRRSEGTLPMDMIRKRSVTIAGHRTSISLEEPFWDGLKRIAHARGQTLNALVGEIDAERKGNLSSALRVYVLRHFMEGRRLFGGDIHPAMGMVAMSGEDD